MEAVYKKVWMSVASSVQPLVDRFTMHLIEQTMEDQSNNFWSFDNMNTNYLSGYR